MSKLLKKAVALSVIITVLITLTLMSAFSAGETVVTLNPYSNTLSEILLIYGTDNTDIRVFDAQNTEIVDTTAKIGTGYKMVYTVTATDTQVNSIFVVRCDIDGDGIVTNADFIGVLKHVTGAEALRDVYLEASDLTYDGIIDGADGMIAELILSGHIAPEGVYGDNEGDVSIFS